MSEKKDEELFKEWVGKIDKLSFKEIELIRYGFLAGLKAGRMENLKELNSMEGRLTQKNMDYGNLKEEWLAKIAKLEQKLEQFINIHNPDEFVDGVKACLVHVRSIFKKPNTHAMRNSASASNPQDPPNVRERNGDRLEGEV